jgi:hypothetical protein
MENLDREVLASIAGDVLRPQLCEEIIATAREMFDELDQPATRDRLAEDLKRIEREQSRLIDAIAAGADMPILVERLRGTEERRRQLAGELLQAQHHVAQRLSWSAIEAQLRKSIMDWRSVVLRGDIAEARDAFRRLLATPIMFTPFEERGRRGIRFEGRIGLDAILGGELVTNVASPTGFEPSGIPFERTFRAA